MRQIQLRERSIAVEIVGNGKPILFVHGFPLDHSMWRGQIDFMSKDHLVIAPDLRGFGKSTPPDGSRPQPVSMSAFADDMAELLDAISVTTPVIFCGLSMGGCIAWQFYKRHRNRLSKLVICDARAACDTPEAAAARQKLADRVLVEGAGILADVMVPRLFAPATAAKNPELVARQVDVIRSTNPVGAIGGLLGLAERPDMTPLLPEIDVPVLAICGEHDVISPPSEMRGIASAIPGAQFIEIPMAGHMAPLENASAVNDAIQQFSLS